MEEIFEDIRTFLDTQREIADEKREKTYEEMLAEFYQIPSYVERFRQKKLDQLEP